MKMFSNIVFCGLLSCPSFVDAKRMVVESSTDQGVFQACESSPMASKVGNTIEQNPGTNAAVLYVSEESLAKYFVSYRSDIKKFLEALHLSSDFPVSTKELCKHSLEYIQNDMGWPIPDRFGQYCTTWVSGQCSEWVPTSVEQMELNAQEIDLATETAMVRNTGVVQEKDVVVDQQTVSQADHKPHFDDSALSWTPADLAIEIANLFNIYPSSPGDAYHGSLLQLEADPKFGPKVREDRKSKWRSIMAQASSWVDTAIRLMPGNLNAVESWFGDSSPSTLATVRKVVTGMKQTLAATTIKVGKATESDGSDLCTEASSTMAFVMVTTYTQGSKQWKEGERDGNRYIINVCERFWKPEFITNPASSFGTMVHESAHHHGPTDESYNGAAPYGRSQCLRMAEEAPHKAQNNADNYAWFVYYLNRCTNSQTSISKVAPCSLELRAGQTGGVKVNVACKKAVVGSTLKRQDRNGHYLSTALNYGEMEVGEFTLKQDYVANRGDDIAFFFESDCAMWEAKATWKGHGVTVNAIQTMVMSSGGSAGGDPSTTIRDDDTDEEKVDPNFQFPCSLSLDKSVKLTDGRSGFKLLAECKSTINDAMLAFTSPDPTEKFTEKVYREISVGTWSIFTNAVEEFQGFVFTFSGKVGVNAGSTSFVMEKARRDPPPQLTKLPCDLFIEDEGGRLRVEGGQPAFKVNVECSMNVKEGQIKFPNTNFADKNYGDFEAGTRYNVLTFKTSDWVGKAFHFCAVADGGGKLCIGIDAPPMPQTVTVSKPSSDRKCHEDICARQGNCERLKVLCGECSWCKSGGAPPAQTGGTSHGNDATCHFFCAESRKDEQCKTTYPLYQNCKGCDFCKKKKGTCRSWCSKPDCDPSYVLYNRCSGCDICR